MQSLFCSLTSPSTNKHTRACSAPLLSSPFSSSTVAMTSQMHQWFSLSSYFSPTFKLVLFRTLRSALCLSCLRLFLSSYNATATMEWARASVSFAPTLDLSDRTPGDSTAERALGAWISADGCGATLNLQLSAGVGCAVPLVFASLRRQCPSSSPVCVALTKSCIAHHSVL